MTPIVGRLAVESPPPVTIHRFTEEEFHRLCEVGILDEDDRVEQGERVPLILGGQSLGELAVKDVLP